MCCNLTEFFHIMQAAKRLRCTPMTSSSVGKQQQLWIDHFDSPDKLTQAVKGTRKPKYIIVILSIHLTSICHFSTVWTDENRKKKYVKLGQDPIDDITPSIMIVIVLLFPFLYHFDMTSINANSTVIRVIPRIKHVKWKLRNKIKHIICIRKKHTYNY